MKDNSLKSEEKKSIKEKEFLDEYTNNYKNDLGINIRNYTTEELTQLTDYELEHSEPIKKPGILKVLWTKLINLLW